MGKTEKDRKAEVEEPKSNLTRRDVLKTAATAGLGAVALNTPGTTEAATTAAEPAQTRLNVGHLIAMMVQDPLLARNVIATPERYQKQYNLSPRAVMSFRCFRLEDFEKLGPQRDPQGFAAGAMVVAGLSRVDFSGIEVEIDDITIQDSCYYFG